jgi:hypothetical protein
MISRMNATAKARFFTVFLPAQVRGARH